MKRKANHEKTNVRKVEKEKLAHDCFECVEELIRRYNLDTLVDLTIRLGNLWFQLESVCGSAQNECPFAAIRRQRKVNYGRFLQRMAS